MITNAVNTKLNLTLLEKELASIQKMIHPNGDYFFREKYVDRGTHDPFYIIRIKEETRAAGDDLMDEPLFATGFPYCQMKYVCRESNQQNTAYWKPISGKTLHERIDRFIRMYRYDYIQPPGTRFRHGEKQALHPQLKGKRYLYEVSSPWKTLTGIGPSGFAGVLTDGAIRGQITDVDGNPAAGVEIELVLSKNTLTRKSEAGGLFWFAKIPKGTYRLRLPNYSGQVHLFYQPYGLLKGKVQMMDNEEKPEALEVEAPDGTRFHTKVEASGDFKPLKIPAFHYKLRIPDHLFRATIRIQGDTIIAGTLKSTGGEVISGATILLLANGAELAKRVSTSNGDFRFELSGQGPYSLKVPGYGLYAKKMEPAVVKGQVSDLEQPILLELIANDRVVSSQHTGGLGHFKFDGLTRGNYKLRASGIEFQMDKHYELTGAVSGTINDENGPVKERVVQLIDKDQNVAATTTSDSSGKIAFTAVSPGGYTLKSAGYVFQSHQTYPISGNIKGVLLDENGEIHKHQRLLLFKNNKRIAQGFTDSNGVFEFSKLTPGDYTVRYPNHWIKLDSQKKPL